MLHEGVLHLAQLDPVTVDLDLIVLTAEEFDIAVGHVAAQVTGGVEVFPCAGVAYEALGRAFGILEVPVGKTVTGDVKLKLYKGNIITAGVTSPESLYSEELVTFNESSYDQTNATGFINLWGLPDTVLALREQGKL